MPLLPALSLVSFARSLSGPQEGCPTVTNAEGNTGDAPWRGSFPGPAELSSWYDAATTNISSAEKWPSIGEVPGGLSKVAELRQLFDALPFRIAAMSDAKANTLKAVKIAQAALCLVHEANEIKRRKDSPKPEPPRPSEEDPGNWWDRFKDWFGFPQFDGGEWKLPELPDFPDLPDVPDFKWPTVEPWMIALGIGALIFLAKKSPQGRAVSRLRNR